MRQIRSQSGLGFLYVPPDTGGGWDWFDDGWGFDDYWGAGSSWDSFLPGAGPGGGYRDYNPILPGYCPPGYYHPIEDPYNCVPFPVQGAPGAPGGAGQGSGSGSGGSSSRTPAPAPAPAPPPRPPCPPPYREQAGRCMPPACPEGQLFNPNTNKCERIFTMMPAPGAPAAGQREGVPSWLWIVLGGAVLIAATGGRR